MNETDETRLDSDRIKKLACEILKLLKENFERGPTEDRDRVYENLNALAVACAVVDLTEP